MKRVAVRVGRAAEQRCNLVGHAIDRGGRVAAPSPRPDLPRTPQIDVDETDEDVSIAGVLANRDTDTADERFVPSDAVNNSVLCVRLKLVRDIDVLAREHDAHTTGQANCEPLRLRREFVLLHFAPKRHRANVKCLGRSLPVALVAFEGSSNQVALLRLEVQRVTRRRGPLLPL
jgi:hypothetical protein